MRPDRGQLPSEAPRPYTLVQGVRAVDEILIVGVQVRRNQLLQQAAHPDRWLTSALPSSSKVMPAGREGVSGNHCSIARAACKLRGGRQRCDRLDLQRHVVRLDPLRLGEDAVGGQRQPIWRSGSTGPAPRDAAWHPDDSAGFSRLRCRLSTVSASETWPGYSPRTCDDHASICARARPRGPPDPGLELRPCPSCRPRGEEVLERGVPVGDHAQLGIDCHRAACWHD